MTIETKATVLELTYLTAHENNNFGIGASLHQSAEVEVSSNLSSITDDIDDSFGFFAVYEFNLDNGLDIGIRYTIRDYEVSNTTYDANSLGVTLSTSF